MILDKALKNINDEKHARDIFTAHLRHQATDYEDLIGKAKGDFRMREVAREFARVATRDNLLQRKIERADIYEEKQEIVEEPIEIIKKEKKKKVKKEKIVDRGNIYITYANTNENNTLYNERRS